MNDLIDYWGGSASDLWTIEANHSINTYSFMPQVAHEFSNTWLCAECTVLNKAERAYGLMGEVNN